MRALAILPEACNRTRQHVSLRLDRQLSELTSGAQVDDELSKMKAELGSGGGDAPALEQGEEKA